MDRVGSGYQWSRPPDYNTSGSTSEGIERIRNLRMMENPGEYKAPHGSALNPPSSIPRMSSYKRMLGTQGMVPVMGGVGNGRPMHGSLNSKMAPGRSMIGRSHVDDMSYVKSLGRYASEEMILHWLNDSNTPKHLKVTFSQEEVREEPFYGLNLSGLQMKVLSPAIANYQHLQCLYICGNNLVQLPLELFSLPGLPNLSVLDVSCNFIQVIPPEIGYLLRLKELSLENNSVRDIPIELGKLFRLKVLKLENNPVMTTRRGLLDKSAPEIVHHLREKLPLPPPPPPRLWVDIAGLPANPTVGVMPPGLHTHVKADKKVEEVRLLCYNVLSEKLATPELYHHCPPKYLQWEHRKVQLLREIVEQNADLAALQEVESGHFEAFLRPEMEKRGYQGLHVAKSRQRTMSGSKASKVDGCAIFYKPDRFLLLDSVWVEYQALSLRRYETEFPDSKEVLDRIMPRDQIGLITILTVTDKQLAKSMNLPANKDPLIMLVNTHIHWDPAYRDVKLIQIIMLLEEIEALISREPRYRDIPMILCGDLNSMPDSGVLQLLKEGTLPANHPDFLGYDYGRYSREGVQHSLSLQSAYAPVGEPIFTNYTDGYVGCLDYMFMSQSLIRPERVLLPPEESSILEQFGALPNFYSCSDHISLVADFKFMRNQS